MSEEKGSGREEKRGPVKRGTKDMLTPQQLADRYGLSVQWAYHCPELKAIRKKIGKYIFYPLAEVERVEKMDRDKATGAKTVPLDEFRQYQERKKLEEAKGKLKMDFADEEKKA